MLFPAVAPVLPITDMWYTGEALYGFGHGLSYTNFSLDWTTGSAPGSVTVPVQSVVA